MAHQKGISSGYYRWIVLAAGTLGVFAALGLARFGYTTVLAPMQHDLGIDNASAGAIASANLIGYLLLSAIGGALAARFGSRIVATIGLAVAAVAMILTATSTGLISASLWRAITGLGSGAANISIMGMWASWFGPRLRGRAAGVAVAGSSLALMATGVVVPRLLATSTHSGWRLCWVLFGATTAIIAVLVWIIVRRRPGHANPSVSPALAPKPAQPKTASELTPSWGAIYRSSSVWHMGIVYAAFGFSYIIYMTFFIKYLVAEHGYSSAQAGRIFFVMGMSSVVCGVLWGAVSDILGRKAALAIVFLIQAISFALFAQGHSYAAILASALLFGLTAWSIPAIMAAACGDMLGPKFAPAALGFITLFFGIGQAVAPSIAGSIADTTGSFSPAFLLAACVAFAGSAGSMLLARKKMIPADSPENAAK